MKNGEEVLSSEKQPEIESCFVSDPLFLVPTYPPEELDFSQFVSWTMA